MNEILSGDCRTLLPSVPSDSVDAVITDIPYGIGYEDWDVLHNNTNSAYGTASSAQLEKGALFKRRGKPLNGWSEADKQIPLEYQRWCDSWAHEVLRVMKPGASCIVFAGRRFSHRCISALEEAGYTFKDMLCWQKDRAPHRAQRLSAIYERRGDHENAEAWNGWKVANMRPLFEPILWFQKPYRIGGTIADNVLQFGVGAWNEKVLDSFNGNKASVLAHSNVIQTRTLPSDKGLHPTQKPLALMELLVELVTSDGAVVLDPFCGSGTTCVAARRRGRRYIGIELDADMANVAQKRLNTEGEMLL